MTLTEFLLARIAEDETVAQSAEDLRADEVADALPYYWTDPATEPAGDNAHPEHEAHVRRFNPARVLAECEAKRRIMGLHAQEKVAGHGVTCEICSVQPDEWNDAGGYVVMENGCETVLFLALPYADHPDYRQEWAA